ncbi:hypothetical protein [Actinophytocola sp.]|uniref:hypothetical protein n=1 Tax=Actinophytocola sp. TaxID=1872138 RepID=UPI002D381310|nr:hypothetical protein [Actinophytocola sp.]HYQ69078.1 hypothetical protein [Actinophytocola sp.]
MATTTDRDDTPLAGLDDDRPWLNPAWFHPVLAALWLLAMSLVTAATGLSPWWWLLVGPALTLLARTVVSMWVGANTHGEAHYDHARAFALGAGLTATAWLVYAGLTDKAGRALGLLALWTVLTGSVYAVLRYQAPRKAEEIRQEERERVEAVQRHEQYVELKELWEGWFEKMDLGGVEVEDVADTRAGYTLHLASGSDGSEKVPQFSQLNSALEGLALRASRYYKKRGITIAPDQVRAEETDTAHEWLLHVDTRQPLKASVPYPGDMGAGSILNPVQIGVYQDASPLRVNLFGVHSLMVGATGSGKSVCLNCVIAGVTRCPDLELWIGTTSKLMPIIWPWLAPWLSGETAKPVIERVAGENLDEVLLMLADLYKVAKLRNRRLGPLGSKHKPTRLDPAILCILDEATDVAENKTQKVRTFDGREWTTSALFKAICQMARSAGIGMFFLTQYGLIDALGDDGPKVMRNITCRIAGRTERAYDGQATLSGIKHVDTTQLRDYKLLVQPNNEVPRVIPGKTYDLDSDRPEEIRPIAIAHTRYRGEGLPQWLQDELGGSYTERWLPFRQPTLVEACEFAGIPYPVPELRDGDDPTGDAAAGDAAPGQRSPQADETGPAGGTSPTGEPLPAEAGTGTLPLVTTTMSPRDTLAAFQAATEQLQAANAEQRDYPLGKAFTLIWEAFRAKDAPEFGPLDKLVMAAKLVAPGASGEEFDAAMAKARRHLDHYGVEPASGDGVPVADFPVYRRVDVLSAWDRAKVRFLAELAEHQRKQDPVLAALDGLDDPQWIGVGELGKRAGQVLEGDVREQARRFSAELRERYRLDDNAFKRTSAGTAVNIGAIRAAASAAASA